MYVDGHIVFLVLLSSGVDLVVTVCCISCSELRNCRLMIYVEMPLIMGSYYVVGLWLTLIYIDVELLLKLLPTFMSLMHT